MNEVRTTQVASQLLASSASSPGVSESPVAASGKTLPAKSTATSGEAAPQAAAESAKSLQSAVASVNDYIQSIQRDLRFSVDEELEQTIIRVVDRDSGEVIRQIPEDIFLELARRLNDDGEFRLLNALG